MRANELGLVPVLMYHQVVPRPKGVYDRTPAEFRKELERLAREDYVPVTAEAYVRGELDVPAGRHPVVLTFDDSTSSQLALGPDGEPRPDTAVGILLDIARRHPDFRPVATFFVNGDPFSEPGGGRTLRWLHEHGFELGNHTLTHANLRRLSSSQVQQELAADIAAIRKAVPAAQVSTLALPFGVWPRDRGLAVKGVGRHGVRASRRLPGRLPSRPLAVRGEVRAGRDSPGALTGDHGPGGVVRLECLAGQAREVAGHALHL